MEENNESGWGIRSQGLEKNNESGWGIRSQGLEKKNESGWGIRSQGLEKSKEEAGWRIKSQGLGKNKEEPSWRTISQILEKNNKSGRGMRSQGLEKNAHVEKTVSKPERSNVLLDLKNIKKRVQEFPELVSSIFHCRLREIQGKSRCVKRSCSRTPLVPMRF